MCVHKITTGTWGSYSACSKELKVISHLQICRLKQTLWTRAHTGSTQTHAERFSSAKMSRAYDRTHRTFTLLSVRIKVRFGYRGGTYCYSSLCSPVHLHHQPTTSSPAILSTTHTQLEYQLQQPGNATSPPERPLEVYGAWGQRLPSGWKLILEIEMLYSPTLWPLIPRISSSIVWFDLLLGGGCVG